MARNVHGDTYDYSGSHFIDSKSQIIIICKKHGEFKQLPGVHLRGSGCKACGYEKLKLINSKNKNNIDDFRNVHGDRYDYSKVEYKSLDEKVIIICKEHGEFLQTPRSHIHAKAGCPKCAVILRANKIRNSFDEVTVKAQAVHGNKYEYLEKSEDTIKAKCHIHGEFEISKKSLLNGRGCYRCSIDSIKNNLRLSFDDFVSRAKQIHSNDYNYVENSYSGLRENINIICPKHGIFSIRADAHIAGSRCPKCRINLFERSVLDYLESFNVQYELFNRSVLDGLELDIFIPSKNLAIECNGIYWHSYDSLETIDQKYKHHRKTTACNNKGVKLLQIFENEWYGKTDIVKSIISSVLGNNKTIYARQCKLESKSAEHLRPFLNASHMQGFKPSGVNYCLIFNDEIVAALTFNRHSKYTWEMGRYATSLFTTVVGGLSKTFKAFVKEHAPSNIVSYADRRFFTGNAYSNIGFVLDGITAPNYKYVKNNNIYSRQMFQKHRMASRLISFSADMTEAENMFSNGYRRLWDAGNYRWIYGSKSPQ